MSNIVIREYKESDIKAMVEIWNEVVEEGVAFPQIDGLTEESGKEFCSTKLLWCSRGRGNKHSIGYVYSSP